MAPEQITTGRDSTNKVRQLRFDWRPEDPGSWPALREQNPEACRRLSLNLPFEYRDYQARQALQYWELPSNLFLVAPTGSGKTLSALLMLTKAFSAGEKILFLVPQFELCEQVLDTARKLWDLRPKEILVLTGHDSPEKRGLLTANSDAQFMVATPETLLNDIRSGRFSLAGIQHVVFDEADLTKGEYAYASLTRELDFNQINCLALSATAAETKAEVIELLGQLNIGYVAVLPAPEPVRLE